MNRKAILEQLKNNGLNKNQFKKISLFNAQTKFASCFMTALSHYPDLKNVHIRLKRKKSLFLMEARPTFLTYFGIEKKFVIFINKKTESVLLNNFSDQSLLALFGHELGHILDYQNRSFGWFLRFGMCYLFPQKRLYIELENEVRTFNHGFAYQMLSYLSDMKKSPLSHSIKQYRRKYYIRKETIKSFLSTINKK